MNSTRTALSVLSTLLVGVGGIFVLPATARQLDTAFTVQSFSVGHQPAGMASDGADIWVSNRTDNTVTKLRASDGALLGTFNVGLNPFGIVFDGANIWIANTTPTP